MIVFTTALVSVAGLIALALLVYFNSVKSTVSQATPAVSIQGTVNSYLRVTYLDSNTKTFTTDNLWGKAADFQAGNTVMVYQSKGASIVTDNTSHYGTVTSYKNAGNYEFTTVLSFTGTGPYTVTVSSLVNEYNSADHVQLVSVPEYTDATVTGTITAIPWDVTLGRGGIVALQVNNVLTLNGNIDVSGLGFTGGQAKGSYSGCPDSTTYRSNSNAYGAKGESFSTEGRFYGRGAQGHAGGGGNSYNAGGGGGSHYTFGGGGGRGGLSGGSCSALNAGGLPGVKVNYTSSKKAFFGGGGGAGQQNEGSASSGAPGGGIIVVRANIVRSSCEGTYGFIADGDDAKNTIGSDGAGGGGAGGTIILDVNSYELTCTLQAQASGGNGGNVNDSGRQGGGGGGGIGAVIEILPSSNPYLVAVSAPGANGKDCNTGDCETPTGSLPEKPAAYKLNFSGNSDDMIVMPVELIFFAGKWTAGEVNLTWATATEENNDHFTLERSADGKVFTPFAEMPGAGNSKIIQRYTATDKTYHPHITYYRLKQTDYDGKISWSDIISVETGVVKAIQLYPNPASDIVHLVRPNEDPVIVRFINDKGIEVFRKRILEADAEIEISSMENGVYLVELTGSSTRMTTRLVVKK